MIVKSLLFLMGHLRIISIDLNTFYDTMLIHYKTSRHRQLPGFITIETPQIYAEVTVNTLSSSGKENVKPESDAITVFTVIKRPLC